MNSLLYVMHFHYFDVKHIIPLPNTFWDSDLYAMPMLIVSGSFKWEGPLVLGSVLCHLFLSLTFEK